MPTFVQSLLRLPPRSKAIVAVSAVAILAIAFLMLKLASSPSYSTLAAGQAVKRKEEWSCSMTDCWRASASW